MAMGMTYDEYWHGKPIMAKYVREAYEIKRKEKSYEKWLEGMYEFVAVQTALANAFRGKGGKVQEFPEKPIDIPEKEKTPEEIRQAMYEQLQRFKENWDAKQGRTDN